MKKSILLLLLVALEPAALFAMEGAYTESKEQQVSRLTKQFNSYAMQAIKLRNRLDEKINEIQLAKHNEEDQEKLINLEQELYEIQQTLLGLEEEIEPVKIRLEQLLDPQKK